jgi:hypothetical protein
VIFYWDNPGYNTFMPGVIDGQADSDQTTDNPNKRQHLWDMFFCHAEHRYTTEYTDPGIWYVSMLGFLNEITGHGLEWHEEKSIWKDRYNYDQSDLMSRAIPEHVKQGMRAGKITLLVDNSAEGKDLTPLEVRYLQTVMNHQGLPRGSVTFLTGCINMKETYLKNLTLLAKDGFTEIAQPMADFLHLPCFEWLSTATGSGTENWNNKITTQSELPPNPIIKAMYNPDSKDYMSLNQNIKRHRMEHIYYLVSSNLIDKGLINASWVRDGERKWWEYMMCIENELEYVGGTNGDMIRDTDPILPLHADVDCSLKHPDEQENNIGNFNNWLYEHSLLSFVAESEYGKYQNSIFITEKTYKTILGGHPFITLNSEGTLAYLRSQGYITDFCDINTEYDSVSDPETRFMMANQELLKWCSRSREEKIMLLHRDMYKLEHNRKLAYRQLSVVNHEDVIRERANTYESIIWTAFRIIETFMQAKVDAMTARVDKELFASSLDMSDEDRYALDRLINQESTKLVNTKLEDLAVEAREQEEMNRRIASDLALEKQLAEKAKLIADKLIDQGDDIE